MLVVREILTYPPGIHVFDPAGYPWAAAMRIILIGGHGGPASDGTPGEPGTAWVSEIVPPYAETIEVGAGGRGVGGGKGDDGLCIIQLYADEGED